MEQKNPDDPKPPQTEKPLEKEEIKKRFLTINDLVLEEEKLITIFSKFKKKLVETKPALFLRPRGYQYQKKAFLPLFQYECIFPLKVRQEFHIVYDCLNFITYKQEDELDAKNNEKYITKLKNIFDIVKDKGAVLLLIDEFHIENFFDNLIEALGKSGKTKYFINFYYLEVRTFLFFVSIQKMAESETPINYSETKILISDYFTSMKLIGSSTMSEMKNYIKEPIIKIKKYRHQLENNFSKIKTLHPGEFYLMQLKSSPLLSHISYNITICDNNNKDYLEKKQCIALLVNYEITQEILYSKELSFNNMCNQFKVARLIIIESAILTPLNLDKLNSELSSEIQLMKPEGFTENINIRPWKDNSNKSTLLEDQKYLIRDIEDKQNNYKRQFFLVNDNNNILLAQTNTKVVSKKNINNPLYYPIETLEKFKEKGIRQCFDDSLIFGFYERTLLCSSFYLDLSLLPKNNFKILDIGAGTGVVPFYFYKLLKGNAIIDCVELEKKIYEIQEKYFGLRFDKDNVKWFFEDGYNYVEKIVKKNGDVLYDLIFNEIFEINAKEETSPPKKFFDDTYLENITKILKTVGIYIVNLCAKNYQAIYSAYLQLEKYFPTIFNIPSEGRLSYIFFCFNSKIDVKEIGEKAKANKELMEKETVVDFSLVKPFCTPILLKVQDMDDERKKIEENSKK